MVIGLPCLIPTCHPAPLTGPCGELLLRSAVAAGAATQVQTLSHTCRDASKRQLVAFIGGLDLCDGRYDTSEHSLFHTIKTVHSDDYHQACCPNGNIKQGGTCSLPSTKGTEGL